MLDNGELPLANIGLCFSVTRLYTGIFYRQVLDTGDNK